MKKKRPLTLYILIAMVLGIIVGYGCNTAFPDAKLSAQIAGNISIVTDVFLRLIKMIIALLVFSTLTVGIAHMGDGKTAGRIGLKACAGRRCLAGLAGAGHGAVDLMQWVPPRLPLRRTRFDEFETAPSP